MVERTQPKKKSAGKPAKARMVAAQFSPEQLAHLQQAASLLSMTVNEFMRTAAILHSVYTINGHTPETQRYLSGKAEELARHIRVGLTHNPDAPWLWVDPEQVTERNAEQLTEKNADGTAEREMLNRMVLAAAREGVQEINDAFRAGGPVFADMLVEGLRREFGDVRPKLLSPEEFR